MKPSSLRAQKLGYVPNRLARGLRNSRTNIIGLLIADIGNMFYAEIARTAESVAHKRGYQIVICNSDESGPTESRLLSMLGEIRVDGLLITPTVENGDALRSLQRSGTPIVQLDRVVDGVTSSTVLVDNADAVSHAIEHLIVKGHRRIVVISGPQSLTTGRERAQGARSIAARYAADIEVEVFEASFMKAHALDTVRRALSLKPTAILAGNNLVAEACVEVLSETDTRIPEEISVIAFDDVPWMQWMPSPLTAIRQPIVEMSLVATTLLLAEVEGRGEMVQQRFATQFVERDSVAAVVHS